jgi:hypothetical protein
MITLPLLILQDYVNVVSVLDSVVNVDVVVPVLILSVEINIISVESCKNESGELI